MAALKGRLGSLCAFLAELLLRYAVFITVLAILFQQEFPFPSFLSSKIRHLRQFGCKPRKSFMQMTSTVLVRFQSVGEVRVIFLVYLVI